MAPVIQTRLEYDTRSRIVHQGLVSRRVFLQWKSEWCILYANGTMCFYVSESEANNNQSAKPHKIFNFYRIVLDNTTDGDQDNDDHNTDPLRRLKIIDNTRRIHCRLLLSSTSSKQEWNQALSRIASRKCSKSRRGSISNHLWSKFCDMTRERKTVVSIKPLVDPVLLSDVLVVNELTPTTYYFSTTFSSTTTCTITLSPVVITSGTSSIVIQSAQLVGVNTKGSDEFEIIYKEVTGDFETTLVLKTTDAACTSILVFGISKLITPNILLSQNVTKKLHTDSSSSSSSLDTIIRRFNVNPSQGLALGKLTNPEKVAEFLLQTTGLDKDKVGLVLGKESSIKILSAFTKACVSKNDLEFLPSLRNFLSRFRLPGESQQIDRIMQAFAVEFYKQSSSDNNILKSVDVVHILAFSTIMLNTDAHNPSARRGRQKMSLEDFIKNNRGINAGEDLPSEFLQSVYDSITSDAIVTVRTRNDNGNLFSDPEMTGWLTMITSSALMIRRSYWFILSHHCLYYFINPSDVDPVGFILLENLSTNLSNSGIELYSKNGIKRMSRTSSCSSIMSSSSVNPNLELRRSRRRHLVLSGDDESKWASAIEKAMLSSSHDIGGQNTRPRSRSDRIPTLKRLTSKEDLNPSKDKEKVRRNSFDLRSFLSSTA